MSSKIKQFEHSPKTEAQEVLKNDSLSNYSYLPSKLKNDPEIVRAAVVNTAEQNVGRNLVQFAKEHIPECTPESRVVIFRGSVNAALDSSNKGSPTDILAIRGKFYPDETSSDASAKSVYLQVPKALLDEFKLYSPETKTAITSLQKNLNSLEQLKERGETVSLAAASKLHGEARGMNPKSIVTLDSDKGSPINLSAALVGKLSRADHQNQAMPSSPSTKAAPAQSSATLER